MAFLLVDVVVLCPTERGAISSVGAAGAGRHHLVRSGCAAWIGAFFGGETIDARGG